MFTRGHIGLVVAFPLTFHIHDCQPIRTHPQKFGKEKWEWICNYCCKQCHLGVLREVWRGIERDPVFAEGLVLVQGGQSAQTYRASANLFCTNVHITMAAHPAVEMEGTLDTLQCC